jgi:ATP synthase protein I
MPSAALVVALLTYVLQVVLMGVVFLALDQSGQLDEGIDRAWLAGTIIGGTMVWLLVQVVLETTRRIPAYDLPESPVASGGGHRPQAGER